MSKLEDLKPGLRLAGVIPGQNVSVIAVQSHGADAIELTYKTAEGDLGERCSTSPHYRLALVCVDPRGREFDVVRYLENPFAGFDAGNFDVTGHRGKWETTWAQGREPF